MFYLNVQVTFKDLKPSKLIKIFKKIRVYVKGR